RLAAADHRVGEHVRLVRRQSTEEDGHAERRHLVVGHLAARVAEDQLGELVVLQLFAVALALDELGRPNHFVATKMVVRPWTRNGSSRSSGRGRVSYRRERRYPSSTSRSSTTATTFTSILSTLEKCRLSDASPFSLLNR